MTDRTSTAALRAQTKDALKSAGISQAAAARQLGLSTKHMSHMLTGRAALTLDWADRILALCGASLLLVATRNQAAPPGPRIALDDLTSDQLDALYARLEDWKQAAGAGMTLTDNLRAERDALAAGVPLVCSDERHKVKVFALEMRADQAEAAIERVRAIHSHGTRTNACNDCGQPWPCELTRALDQPQPPTTTDHHAFEQDLRAETVIVCRCGKWPDHHIHTCDTRTCGCDACRTARATA